MTLTAGLRESIVARVREAHQGSRPITRLKITAFLLRAYERFVESGLADPIFLDGFLHKAPAVHAQRVAELLLADLLWKKGFSLKSSASGPDFRAFKNGQEVWIELITPEPVGIPPDHLTPKAGGVGSFPHEAINLRWTSAIKEKAQKLLGDSQSGRQGYLERGIVPRGACYVIAVNQRLLHGSYRTMDGISGVPAPAEVLFGIGPIQLKIDRESGAIVDRGHMHRPELRRDGKPSVPAETFLDSAFAPISAVWGLDLSVGACIGLPVGRYIDSEHLSVVVHNPLALQPLPRCFLPAQSEWTCTLDGEVRSVVPISCE